MKLRTVKVLEIEDKDVEGLRGGDSLLKLVPFELKAQAHLIVFREMVHKNVMAVAEPETRAEVKPEVKALVLDLMEFALDCRMPECERSWVDSSQRYVELRNEAVRLGLHHGRIVSLKAET